MSLTTPLYIRESVSLILLLQILFLFLKNKYTRMHPSPIFLLFLFLKNIYIRVHPSPILLVMIWTPKMVPPESTVQQRACAHSCCLIPPFPDFTISWSRDSGRLPYNARAEQGQLIIPRAAAADSGVYACLAVSGQGDRYEARAREGIESQFQMASL